MGLPWAMEGRSIGRTDLTNDSLAGRKAAGSTNKRETQE
jgi:hypothetical protein